MSLPDNDEDELLLELAFELELELDELLLPDDDLPQAPRTKIMENASSRLTIVSKLFFFITLFSPSKFSYPYYTVHINE